uniref:Uncharacterized protein n=1 Tax=Trichobilharzia regenti TaxID=157069 RepID=A0AA85IYC2_TRIRE|nr:unnamed protein product [Trichobilharzia regenti]
MIKISILLLLLLNFELVIPQVIPGAENVDITTDTTFMTSSELDSSTAFETSETEERLSTTEEFISTTNDPETSAEQTSEMTTISNEVTSEEATTNETDGTATDSSTDETPNADSSTNQVQMGIIVLIIFVTILTLIAVASIIYHVLRKDKPENVTVIQVW